MRTMIVRGIHHRLLASGLWERSRVLCKCLGEPGPCSAELTGHFKDKQELRGRISKEQQGERVPLEIPPCLVGQSAWGAWERL